MCGLQRRTDRPAVFNTCASALLHDGADARCIDTIQGRFVDEWLVQTVQWPINRLIDVVQMRASNQHSS